MDHPIDRGRDAGDDVELSRIAVERGLIPAEKAEEYLRRSRDPSSRGERVPLSQLLITEAGIDPQHVMDLVREQTRRSQGVPEISRYKSFERLGEGATSIVYRAWDAELGRPVAVKVLRHLAGLSEISRQRFRREAQVAAGISHPHVVAVHDVGEAGGQLYLVMEWVEGRSLAEMLAKDRPDDRSLLRLLEKAARGVASAHARGIVHRDLKPANILVTSSGEPKVGDFGLAHLPDTRTELTKTGATLGTPLYMAPEQVQGHSRDVTSRTDVYALGVILYEILTGAPPHQGDSAHEIYEKIVREDPVPPRRTRSGVSRDVETIALKALEKSPDRRYASAAAFADDLARCLAGEPIEARPPSWAGRLWRKAVKHRSILIPVLTVGLVAATVGVWAITNAVRKSRKIATQLAEAVRLEKAGQVEDARLAFRSVLELDPRHPEAEAGVARTRAAAEKLGVERMDRVRSLRVPRVEQVAGEVYLVTRTGRERAQAGRELAPGEGLETQGETGRARLKYLDETVVEVRGDTALHCPLDSEAPPVPHREMAKFLKLRRGYILVATQPTGSSLQFVETGQMLIGASYCVFSLFSAADATHLKVWDGAAATRPAKGGKAVEVKDEHMAAAFGDGEIRVEPLPSTELGRNAAELKPRLWVELETEGFQDPEIVVPGGATWDPTSRQFLFQGRGKGPDKPWAFVAYGDESNRWKRIDPHPDLLARTEEEEASDHNTLDPATGDHYYRPSSSDRIYKYGVKDGAWQILPPVPDDVLRARSATTAGLEYFSEMGGLLLVAGAQSEGGAPPEGWGAVGFFSTVTQKWNRLAGRLPVGRAYPFIEYNPVHQVAILGGGEGRRELYKVDAAGQVTRLKDAPIGLGTTHALVTVDPVGGKYLAIARDRSFYEYDVTSDTWTALAKAVPRGFRIGRNVIETPVTTYGVILFVVAAGPDSKVYLYKHTESGLRR